MEPWTVRKHFQNTRHISGFKDIQCYFFVRNQSLSATKFIYTLFFFLKKSFVKLGREKLFGSSKLILCRLTFCCNDSCVLGYVSFAQLATDFFAHCSLQTTYLSSSGRLDVVHLWVAVLRHSHRFSDSGLDLNFNWKLQSSKTNILTR